VFPFSPRPGTPAARMPQHAPQLVKERAQRLRQHGDTAVTRHLDRYAGRTVELLMENASHGRAADFTEMTVDREMLAGAFVHARVDGHQGGKLLGAALA
jgi:threonylcarbamoyladenosine tRNA methylthiotransferase MtaB